MTAPCLRFERDVVLMLVLVSACGARSSARALQNPLPTARAESVGSARMPERKGRMLRLRVAGRDSRTQLRLMRWTVWTVQLA